MLWKFNSVFNPELQLADHQRPARYLMPVQPDAVDKVDRNDLYVHGPGGRKTRALDDATETFVDKTRMGEDA